MIVESPRKFKVGDNLDIQDTVKKWCNGEVLSIRPHDCFLLIRYTGWSSKWDEWLSPDNPRILPQWQPGRIIHINNRIDVRHPQGGWREARVIEKQSQQMVKVHFYKLLPKYDIVVNITDPSVVAEVGKHSPAYGIGKRRSKLALRTTELILERLKLQNKQFRQQLKTKKLVIKEVGGDGNCLFRSISDQLYGTEQYHVQIRALCLDYIQREKDFFRDYVQGDFELYVKRKRMDGVWGDDVEIQAISEIYNRPVQIFANGNTPIRTFHEENDNKAILPLRLAYHGQCHYNSIKDEDKVDEGIMNCPFGEIEQAALSAISNVHSIAYRNQFSEQGSVDQRLVLALAISTEQLQKSEQDNIDKQLQKMCENDSLLEQIQQAELKQISLAEEQERLDAELKMLEEKELEEIKKLSMAMMEKQKQEAWIQNIREMGFSDQQIMMAIDAKGRNPDAVLNYLSDYF